MDRTRRKRPRTRSGNDARTASSAAPKPAMVNGRSGCASRRRVIASATSSVPLRKIHVARNSTPRADGSRGGDSRKTADAAVCKSETRSAGTPRRSTQKATSSVLCTATCSASFTATSAWATTEYGETRFFSETGSPFFRR